MPPAGLPIKHYGTWYIRVLEPTMYADNFVLARLMYYQRCYRHSAPSSRYLLLGRFHIVGHSLVLDKLLY